MDRAMARRIKAEMGADIADSDAGDTDAGIAGSPRFERFEITRRLGLGGMGVVFEAEQSSPRRRVAVKVVRSDCFSERARRRFEVEVEALARLRHRGIAQIYEAGVAEGEYGPQPYFAMELVEGETIVDYAEREGLSTPQRLGLFVEVCDAVEHAHQRGVIHRDLKPSNIVVDVGEGRACPKVLDFGVARATDSDVRSTTVHTDVGQIVGTLAYMSPEQAGGDPDEIDTRSDVYSLGVVLYELLTGRVPIEIAKGNVAAAVRAIQEDPPKALGGVDRRLRGDLETIVGKALAKERGRRYSGAAALAEDVRRYLDDEPIEARPPSAVYQVRKFARRHRGLMGVFVVGLVGVIAAGVVGVVFGVGEARARREAEAARVSAEESERRAAAELARAETLVAFVKEMLAGAEPDVARGMDTELMRTILDRSADGIDAAGLEPSVEAELRAVLGGTYRAMSEYGSAALQLRTAVRLWEEEGDERNVVASMGELGLVETLMGEYEPARAHLSEALERGRGSLRANNAVVLSAMESMAALENRMGNFSAAHKLIERVLQGRAREFGPDHPATLSAKNDLALSYGRTGRLELGVRIAREVLDTRRRLFDDDTPDTISAMHTLAHLLDRGERFDDARVILEEALTASERVFGAEHEQTLIILQSLANAYGGLGRESDAERLTLRVLDARTRLYGAQHPQTLMTRSDLAASYLAQGRVDDAVSMFEEARAGYIAALGESHPRSVMISMNLGWAYSRARRTQDACTAFDGVVKLIRESEEVSGGLLAHALRGLGKSLFQLERYEETAVVLEESYGLLAEERGAFDPFTLGVVRMLVETQKRLGADEQVAEWSARLEPTEGSADDGS